MALLPTVLLLHHPAGSGREEAVLVIWFGAEARHDLVGVQRLEALMVRAQLFGVRFPEGRRVRQRVQTRIEAVKNAQHWGAPCGRGWRGCLSDELGEPGQRAKRAYRLR